SGAGRREDREAASGSAARGVGGPDDPIRRLEVGPDLGPAPDVVSEGDRVGAGGEDAIREPRRDAGPVRNVLAVHDAEVDPPLLAQPGQAFLQRAPAGRTEDVRDEEELQGSASWAPGLGLTTIETWLPASRVYR